MDNKSGTMIILDSCRGLLGRKAAMLYYDEVISDAECEIRMQESLNEFSEQLLEEFSLLFTDINQTTTTFLRIESFLTNRLVKISPDTYVSVVDGELYKILPIPRRRGKYTECIPAQLVGKFTPEHLKIFLDNRSKGITIDPRKIDTPNRTERRKGVKGKKSKLKF